MNNGQLKQRLRDESKRKDLDPYLQNFINDAGRRINNRFGTHLGDLFEDIDTNSVLANQHLLYFYDAMRSLSIFIKDFDESMAFDSLWEAEAKRMNIHNRDESWVTDAQTNTKILSEYERAAILAAEGS